MNQSVSVIEFSSSEELPLSQGDNGEQVKFILKYQIIKSLKRDMPYIDFENVLV